LLEIDRRLDSCSTEGTTPWAEGESSTRRKNSFMQRTSKNGTLILAGAFVATAFAAGCASAPLRTEPSTSGIRAAEEVGAREVPRAALHLQLAEEQLNKAKAYKKDGEDEMAASMLTRAEADAELAVLLSREDAEKSAAQAAVQRVHELRQDNAANTESNTP
jgi:hypothetical protein